jgi:hypothetical protein
MAWRKLTDQARLRKRIGMNFPWRRTKQKKAEMGGTLSPTSLIISAVLMFERLGQTRRKGSKSKPDNSSCARREEEKWDAEDSVPPGNGWWPVFGRDAGD